MLEIDRLSVRYGATVALDEVSLNVAAGEIVALVGASGSGKSTLGAAAMALLPDDVRQDGSVRIDGIDLAPLNEAQLQAVRGSRIGMIFQEPATALNPALTIGAQIGEVLERQTPRRGAEIAAAVRKLLGTVGLDVAPGRYPHSLSGGQRQRVAIAMAIAGDPAMLLADEPTASLDPIARASVIDLLVSLVRERGMGLLLITHDLELARRVADRIVTLDQGRVVPNASIVPARPALAARVTEGPLLVMRGVTRTYPTRHARLAALENVSLELARGETLAVVGESGSGKSTLARLALGLDRPDAGIVAIDGQDWRIARSREAKAIRRRVQAVFQDPAASFDPRQTVRQIVGEPLHLLGKTVSLAERNELVAKALQMVGLSASASDRLPQAFSGGQRQRIAIARAIVLKPDLIVLDEALSALDQELREEIVALLLRLQADLGTAFLFIAHDPALVRQMADRVLVLRQGRVVAQGTVTALSNETSDPYLAKLLQPA